MLTEVNRTTAREVTAWWIISRVRGGRIEAMTVPRGGGEDLAVFGHEEEARLFLWSLGPGKPGDVWSILGRFVVDGVTIEENSRKISYDGWKTSASAGASGGTYRQGASETFGARCGLLHGDPQLGLITAKGPTRGMAMVRALDTLDNSVAAERTVNLRAPKVEWQHVVPVTRLQASKTYILKVVSADGAPVVFDGCVGPVSGPIN